MTDELLSQTAPVGLQPVSPPARPPKDVSTIPSQEAALAAIAGVLNHCRTHGIWYSHRNTDQGHLTLIFRSLPIDALVMLDNAIGQCVRSGKDVRRIPAGELVLIIPNASLRHLAPGGK